MFCKSAAAVGVQPYHQELSIRSMRLRSLPLRCAPGRPARCPAHGSAKARVLLEQTQGGVLYEVLGIRTGMTGNSG